MCQVLTAQAALMEGGIEGGGIMLAWKKTFQMLWTLGKEAILIQKKQCDTPDENVANIGKFFSFWAKKDTAILSNVLEFLACLELFYQHLQF